MRRLLNFFAVVNLALLSISQISIAKVEYLSHNSKENIPNRKILVKYKNQTRKSAVSTHFARGAYLVKSFDHSKIDLVEVARGVSVEAALEAYNKDPNVAYAERDGKVKILFMPPPFGPPEEGNPEPPKGDKDPYLYKQWGLNSTIQSAEGEDVDINADEMWADTLADENIAIAVIDTGINYKHPDLENNIWVNTLEIPGNGIDDDNNGVVDDIHGLNSREDNGDPMDDHGHGSHCAGVIAAENGNEYGGSGVMQKAKVIGCKFLDRFGYGEISDAVECMEYLLALTKREKDPVKIIASSNSWGMVNEDSLALRDAIKAHEEAGILFFAAASNEGKDNDSFQVFPANYYEYSNVITVAATTKNDDLAYFSNYGDHSVHLGAPGAEIYSTVLEDKYESMDGTSMATPFAAGLAGMIFSKYPEYDYRKVKNLLMSSGTPIAALTKKTISGRRIRGFDENGRGALSCKDQYTAKKLSPIKKEQILSVGDAAHFSFLNINCASGNVDSEEIKIVYPNNPENNFNLTLYDDGENGDKFAGDGVYSIDWVFEKDGFAEAIFSNQEKVNLAIYDLGELFTYSSTNEEYNYREFEGTSINAEDESVYALELPFNINFGGYKGGFDHIYISSNGALSFTEDLAVDYNNTTFPTNSHSTLIAPYWDDLSPTTQENIYYEFLGEAPNRELVIEWRDVKYFWGGLAEAPKSGITFQVVLFENSSDVLINYKDTSFEAASNDKGASASIGIQTKNDRYHQYSFNEAKIENETSIRFIHPDT